MAFIKTSIERLILNALVKGSQTKANSHSLVLASDHDPISVTVTNPSGGSGGSGGATAAEIKTAIETATTLDGIETLLGSQATAANTQTTRLTEIRDFVDTLETTNSSIDSKLTTTNTTLANQPPAGSPITGASMPSGGVGAYGWWSAIWKLISDRLPSALVGGKFSVDVTFPTTQAISAANLPLPSGAATETSLAGASTALTGIATSVGLPTANPATSDTDNVGVIGLFKRLLQRITTFIGLFPTSLGAKTAANSFSVALSTDGIFPTNFGLTTDATAASDTANSSFISLFKYFLTRISTLITTNQSIRDRLLATTGTTPYRSIGTAVSAVIKNSAGSLLTVTATNLDTTNTLYLQFFNKTALPTANEVPFASYPVYEKSGFVMLGQDIFGGEGETYSNGIVFGYSTTPLIYTASDATKLILNVRYR